MTWKTPPTRFKKQVQKDAGTLVKRLGFSILRNVVVASPTDTGRFVNNWVVGIANRITGTLGGTDKNKTAAIARGKAKLRQYKAFNTLYISNNLPYARRLNEGWSDQAPANFVEQAIHRASTK